MKTQLDNTGKSRLITLSSKKTQTDYEMSYYELSRWCALIDAIDVINKQLENSGDPGRSDRVKPIAIQKYVDEKYQDILHDIMN